MLESDTKNMSIKDANGLDRFKCGFVVDNFQNGTAQSKLDPDFNASIDNIFEIGLLFLFAEA